MSSLHNAARVAIIDDEPDITETVAELLGQEGFESVTFTDGAEALDFISRNEVDLVLLDVMMPGLDGFAVARQIKEEVSAGRFIPVIMLSALQEEEDKVTGLGYADDYVTKPFSYEELLARIRSMLRIRQLQKELIGSRGRYQCLYENIPQMCLSMDADGVVTDCNVAFCRVTGLNKWEVTGRRIESFFHHSEHRYIVQFLEDLKMRESLDGNAVYRMSVSNGEGVPLAVMIRGAYIGGELHDFAYVVAMQDETRRIELEEQQKIARRQLYRSAHFAAIGTLASGVAHEMNNPLAAVLGFSDALLHRLSSQDEIDRAELKEYLEVINSESLRCRDIVKNLSNFARNQEPQIGPVSLLDSLDTVVNLVNASAQKKGIGIAVKIDSDVILRADAHKVRQAFLNVLTNALDFCASGCAVEVTAHVETDGGFAQVRVKDNGPGISRDVLPKVFDPFFTTKEVGYGAGLGLAICHKFLEDCNARIDVESRQGEGTVVEMVFPVCEDV
jgi:hypothetical protein